MMKTVNIHEAKTRLSRLLKRVAAGEEIVITHAGKPVARLVSAQGARGERALGKQRGQFEMPADFDVPLPGDVITGFESLQIPGSY